MSEPSFVEDGTYCYKPVYKVYSGVVPGYRIGTMRFNIKDEEFGFQPTPTGLRGMKQETLGYIYRYLKELNK